MDSFARHRAGESSWGLRRGEQVDSSVVPFLGTLQGSLSQQSLKALTTSCSLGLNTVCFGPAASRWAARSTCGLRVTSRHEWQCSWHVCGVCEGKNVRHVMSHAGDFDDSCSRLIDIIYIVYIMHYQHAACMLTHQLLAVYFNLYDISLETWPTFRQRQWLVRPWRPWITRVGGTYMPTTREYAGLCSAGCVGKRCGAPCIQTSQCPGPRSLQVPW